MTETRDILIVGAGPAGMAAATRLAELGARPLVVDEQPLPGGQIWRAAERARPQATRAALGPDYAAGAERIARFRASGVDYAPNTRMWHVEPGFRVYLSRDGAAFPVEARNVLLATGAQERPAPAPGWTLPGVMTVGAAQILMKTSAQIPDGPVWVCGAGPLPILYMRQLLAAGGKIAGFLDTTPRGAAGRVIPHLLGAWRGRSDLFKGLRWLRELKAAGVPVWPGASRPRAIGTDRLSKIAFCDRQGREHRMPASVLLLHEGVTPSIHASMAMGCEHDWNAAQGCFVPRTDEWGMASAEGLYIAGDGAGVAGAMAAEARGTLAALAIARRLGLDVPEGAVEAARRDLAAATASRGFIDALYPPPSPADDIPDDTVICRCEELTAGEIREAAKIYRGGPNQIKAVTRCGMGPCQGRQCGYTLNRILAREYGQSQAEVGLYRARPPLGPVTLGELAAMGDAGETS